MNNKEIELTSVEKWVMKYMNYSLEDIKLNTKYFLKNKTVKTTEKNKIIEQRQWNAIWRMARSYGLQWSGITLEVSSSVNMVIMVIPTSSNGFDRSTILSLGCKVTPATWELLKQGYTAWMKVAIYEGFV